MSVDFKQFNILAVAMHPGWVHILNFWSILTYLIFIQFSFQVKTDLGGPKAPLEISESCDQMINTISKLEPKANGTFIQYDGKKLPW